MMGVGSGSYSEADALAITYSMIQCIVRSLHPILGSSEDLDSL